MFVPVTSVPFRVNMKNLQLLLSLSIRVRILEFHVSEQLLSIVVMFDLKFFPL